jgi:urease accessory protein
MRAVEVLAAGAWEAGRAVDRVLVDHDRRHRRRIRLTSEAGQDVLLDLAHAVALRHGDGLLLEDGGIVRVEARPEPLADIHAHDDGALVRIAWHLGNRHLPVQMLGEHLRIRRDHEIEAMVELLGGHVMHVEAPFDPETGAYAGGHQHLHDDDEPHAHGHHHHG